MAIFNHRTPPLVGSYRTFKSSIQEDFRRCCAYCLMHEIIMGGEEAYELDHRKPQTSFHGLINDYNNIYYSCKACNKSKWSHWPSPTLLALGRVYIDSAKEDFATHFKESTDCTWHPLTPAAEYTLEKIDLNRPSLVILRKILRNNASKLAKPPPNWQIMDLKYIKSILEL